MAARAPSGSVWTVLIFLGLLGATAGLVRAVLTVWNGLTREQAPIIGAGIALLAALVTAAFAAVRYLHEQSQREQDQILTEQTEAEHQRDQVLRYHRNLAAALCTKIHESMARLATQFTHDTILEQLPAIAGQIDEPHAAGTRPMPAGITMEENIIFDAHRDKTFEHPEDLVCAVVRSYHNDSYLNRYLGGMSTGTFDGLSADRQKRAVVPYREVGRSTLTAAIRAHVMIDANPLQRHGVGRNLSQNLTPARAAACFAAFPDDETISEMLDDEQQVLFENVLKGEKTNDTTPSAYGPYLQVAGVA